MPQMAPMLWLPLLVFMLLTVFTLMANMAHNKAILFKNTTQQAQLRSTTWPW